MSTEGDTQSEEQHDDYATTDRNLRWIKLNSVLTFVLVLSVPVILTFILLTGTSFAVVPQSLFLLYATLVMMATVWAYGSETLEAVREARGD